MDRARFDWLAELGGAAALAAAGGYAALKAAPSFALPGPASMTVAGFGLFAVGMVAMRAVAPGPRHHPLPEFTAAPIATEELLLEDVYEEPLLLTEVYAEDDALLLEDALPAADVGSRVVQLFALAPVPTPGELKDRIDRHLAGAARGAAPNPPAPDATRALYAALDDLKRSLR